MNYEIQLDEKELKINIAVPDKSKKILLEEFGNCQKGKCSCPTEEYKKLDSLFIDDSKNNIFLSLKPKANESLNINEINKCLNYTFKKIKEEK